MEQNLEQILADANTAMTVSDHAQAKQLYTDALELDGDSSTAHYGLGSIALYQNRLSDALGSLAQAAKIEPEAADIAFNYGYALARSGEKLKALMQFQIASRYCQADPVICTKLADMFLKLQEPNAAIQMLSRLDALLPNDQILLAKAHGAMNNWREAVNVLQRLSNDLPNESIVLGELSIAAAKLRDYKTAVSAFEQYLRIVTPAANDYLRFADLLLIAQLPERCEKAIELALSMGEDEPEIFMLKAKVHRLKGLYDKANSELDNVLTRKPNHGQAWSIRAELSTKDKLDEHIDKLKEELAKDEQISSLNYHHQALLYYALGSMEERCERYHAAADSFRRANGVQKQFLIESNNVYVPEQNSSHTNEVIDQFNIDLLTNSEALILSEDSSPRPIFIVGMPRSGTTLVERMLGQNTKLFNAGELEGMEFVTTELNNLQRLGKLPSVDKIAPSEWAELRQSYFAKLPEFSQAIFTDKLPHNFRNVGLIYKLFPEAKIIQMHRSAKDVCLSIFCHAFAPSHNYAADWSSLGHFYAESERLMRHWSSLNSSRILDLNYEDLVNNPEKFGQQLVEFCGFSWDESYLDFHKSIKHSFTFSEMEVREPIAAKRVDRWRCYEAAIPELSSLVSR